MDTNLSERLEEMVLQSYSNIATSPGEKQPFPTGRELAEGVGYPPDLLDTLPLLAVEAFCGVSNVPLLAHPKMGDRVLDLGCGAGMDSILAALRGAQVAGVDFSEPMLERARNAAVEAGVSSRIDFYQAPAWLLPFASESFDVVMINGLLNLNPRRKEVLDELTRVLRPGGRVHAAELVLRDALDPREQDDLSNWFG